MASTRLAGDKVGRVTESVIASILHYLVRVVVDAVEERLGVVDSLTQVFRRCRPAGEQGKCWLLG